MSPNGIADSSHGRALTRETFVKLRPVNLGRLDLVSIRLAVLCARSGSLSTAADTCHLSVSGASDRLRRLEESLGVRLFVRRRYGMEPTNAGAILFDGGGEILRAIEVLVNDIRNAG